MKQKLDTRQYFDKVGNDSENKVLNNLPEKRYNAQFTDDKILTWEDWVEYYKDVNTSNKRNYF